MGDLRLSPLARSTLVAFLVIGLLSGVSTAGVAQDIFSIEKVGDGVYAAISSGGPPTVSNSGFVVLSDGVLVIDSHLKPKAARALLEEIQRRTNKPVRYLVETHFHRDHVGGNPAFPEGIDILAHRRTYHRLQQSNPTQSRLPNALLRDGITFIRGKEVRIKFSGRGHTPGDIYVHLPEQEILFSGDLVFNGLVGFMMDGYPLEWDETLQSLIDLDPETVVPGHGAVTDVQGIRNYQRFLRFVVGRVQALKNLGLDKSEVVSQFELPDRYSGWSMGEHVLEANLERVYEHLE